MPFPKIGADQLVSCRIKTESPKNIVLGFSLDGEVEEKCG
ncbi:hypothetical protein CSC28_6975 (plasmid) [Pseudomonas paraeruginosa]|nr:hypothetical protein CSC28_6975 [Pseudomonas paraeruginosa]